MIGGTEVSAKLLSTAQSTIPVAQLQVTPKSAFLVMAALTASGTFMLAPRPVLPEDLVFGLSTLPDSAAVWARNDHNVVGSYLSVYQYAPAKRFLDAYGVQAAVSLQAIHDLVVQAFPKSKLAYSTYVDFESDRQNLLLEVDASDMPIKDQMELEIQLHERIALVLGGLALMERFVISVG